MPYPFKPWEDMYTCGNQEKTGVGDSYTVCNASFQSNDMLIGEVVAAHQAECFTDGPLKPDDENRVDFSQVADPPK